MLFPNIVVIKTMGPPFGEPIVFYALFIALESTSAALESAC